MLSKRLLQQFIRFFFKVYFFINGYPKTNSNLKKVLGLYKEDSSFGELFTTIRIWDAPINYIEKIIPKKGLVTDLGCGEGILVNYIAISSRRRKVVGIEIDGERINRANKNINNAKFIKGDILKVKFPKSDSILLVHVLHHLHSLDNQITLLKKAYSLLDKNGKLIIVEISEKPLLKYAFTWLTDAIIVPNLFENKFFSTNFFYRKENEWKKLLSGLGFSVKIKRVHRGMPFSHIVLECQKN